MTRSAPTAADVTQGRALRLDGDRPALFISDLHLDPQRPETVVLFRDFMARTAPRAGSLFILGDFFEAWVGDDDLPAPFNADIVSALATLSAGGTALYFLHGNRDFLAGAAFARAAGLHLLPDPVRIELFGTPTLLSHGDVFCSDDGTYQAFRAQVRQRDWQTEFLGKPIEARHAFARALRERSEHAKAGKKPDIMDVNLDTVARHARAADVRRIIHGHTHRPARHVHDLGDRRIERWVLPDWHDTGGYLICDRSGCRALPWPRTEPSPGE